MYESSITDNLINSCIFCQNNHVTSHSFLSVPTQMFKKKLQHFTVNNNTCSLNHCLPEK